MNELHLKLENRPNGENSPNLVTLNETDKNIHYTSDDMYYVVHARYG
jgi:hypothetical protein